MLIHNATRYESLTKGQIRGKNNLLKDIAVLPQSRYSFSFAQSLRAFLFPKSAATRIAVVAISFFKWKRNSIKPLLAHRMNVVVSFARRDKCKLVGGDGMAGRFSMPVMSCRGSFMEFSVRQWLSRILIICLSLPHEPIDSSISNTIASCDAYFGCQEILWPTKNLIQAATLYLKSNRVASRTCPFFFCF